jgi:lipopolysaccharide/colanic/teichoic acid biosynthesis glycosyltransferase
LLATMIFTVSAYSIDLYKTFKYSLIKVFKTNFATFFILAAITFFMKQFAFSRMVVAISAVFSTLAMLSWRLILRRYWRGARSMLGRDIIKRRTVLVGTDERTEGLVEKMKQPIKTGIDLVGLVSLSVDDVGKKVKSISVVTSLDNLKAYVRLEKIDQVIFSTFNITYEMIIKTMSKIGSSTVEYKIIPQNLEIIIGKASVERFTDYQLLDVEYAIGKPYNRILKRTFDLVLSFFILLFTCPVWFLRLLYKRKSIKRYRVWGAKSEKVTLFQSEGKIFKGFFNRLLMIMFVFTGRFSFVGAPFRLVKESQPLYFYKPGLFGLMQLNEKRLDSAEEKERYELYYLQNQNIWLDLEIILKSLFQRAG